MTPQEINALDRDALREAYYENVVGWKQDGQLWLPPFPTEWLGGTLPNPYTAPAACWEITDRLIESGFTVDIATNNINVMVSVDPKDAVGLAIILGHDNTRPSRLSALATCLMRAALKVHYENEPPHAT